MVMDFATMGSIGSVTVALIALLVSVFSTGKKETKEDSAHLSQMMTKLDELAEDLKEIKDDFRREIAELKAAHQSDHDKLIKLEISLDTAWKRIDELRAKAKEA